MGFGVAPSLEPKASGSSAGGLIAVNYAALERMQHTSRENVNQHTEPQSGTSVPLSHKSVSC